MSAQPLHARVRQALPPPPGGPLVVGVSGGPDSLCLLHALHSLRAPLHVLHLDHGLRADSAADAAFVLETAAAWGLPCHVVRRDVGALAGNTYAAGRAARYAALAALALAVEAAAVLVAHTADDQAETVLIHLLRGAGAAGLRGMRPLVPWPEWARFGGGDGAAPAPAGPPLLRPLLTTSRAEVERYCAAHGLTPRHDPSNADPTHTRSRIRHELLPLLREYNPEVGQALTRTAEILADEHDFIAAALAAVWPTLVTPDGGALVVARAAWLALHPALQRAAVRRIHQTLAPGEPLSVERVEAARGLLARGGIGTIELPGPVRVMLANGRARFERPHDAMTG